MGSALSPPVHVPVMTCQRTFAAILSQVGQARRYLPSVVDGHQAADDAMTCLSELATNVVTHSDSRMAGGTFHVCLTIVEGQIRIEVADQGGRWQPRYLAGDGGCEDECGRGLEIVAALSCAWGIAGNLSGRTAWCELDCLSAPRV
jgi:serine/threonine-protein kinase RsbW